jgi:hypothetical protein
VNVFNIYLCPVMKRNGQGVPINQEQRVLFHVVAPLPETGRNRCNHCLLWHETTHRLTDRLVDSAQRFQNARRCLARKRAFHADHIFLKAHFHGIMKPT